MEIPNQYHNQQDIHLHESHPNQALLFVLVMDHSLPNNDHLNKWISIDKYSLSTHSKCIQSIHSLHSSHLYMEHFSTSNSMIETTRNWNRMDFCHPVRSGQNPADLFLTLNWQKSGFVRSGRTGPSSATIVSSKRSFRIDKSFIFETNKKFSIENIIFQTILLTMLIICAIFLHTCYSSVAKIIIIQNW